MSIAIRQALDLAKQQRQLRIDRRDNVLADRIADAMQLAPGDTSPSTEDLCGDHAVKVTHLPAGEMSLKDQGDLLAFRTRVTPYSEY